jgi:hypothetical protein
METHVLFDIAYASLSLSLGFKCRSAPLRGLEFRHRFYNLRSAYTQANSGIADIYNVRASPKGQATIKRDDGPVFAFYSLQQSFHDITPFDLQD